MRSPRSPGSDAEELGVVLVDEEVLVERVHRVPGADPRVGMSAELRARLAGVVAEVAPVGRVQERRDAGADVLHVGPERVEVGVDDLQLPDVHDPGLEVVVREAELEARQAPAVVMRVDEPRE